MSYRVKQEDYGHGQIRYYPQYKSFFSWYGYEVPNNYEMEDESSILNRYFTKEDWSGGPRTFNYLGDIFFYSFENAIKFMRLREGLCTVAEPIPKIEYREVAL